MMPILACCPKMALPQIPDHSITGIMRTRTGFTLLEMLVVMAMISLMMSLVGPAFINRLEQSQRRFAVEQVQSQLAQLPRWARLFGQPLVLEKLSSALLVNNEELLSLPDGWRAEFTPALLVSPTQICSTSSITLFDEASVPITSLNVTTPYCAATEAAP